MQSTLKEDICNFLADGCVTATHSLKEFVEAFYFLEYVCNENSAVTNDGTHIIAKNNNWFWLKSNDTNRQELINDIEKTVSFDNSDPNAKDIVSRLVFGDGYGIVKPVKRDAVEPFDEKAFNDAVAYYSLFEKMKAFQSEGFKAKLYYKFIYGSKHQIPSIEVYCWDLYERLLKKPLNYYEYKMVDGILYGSVEELTSIYMSDEYDEILTKMQKRLMNHRAHLVLKSTSLAQKIELFHQRGELEKAWSLWNELESFYEAPEGASEKEKERYKQAYVDAKDKIPARVRSDLLNIGLNKKR